MHVIAMVLFVFFVQTVGNERPPQVEAVTVPGLTLAECQKHGPEMVARLRTLPGVAGAEFQCVDQIQKASIQWRR
jgi:hypothetical protein